MSKQGYTQPSANLCHPEHVLNRIGEGCIAFLKTFRELPTSKPSAAESNKFQCIQRLPPLPLTQSLRCGISKKQGDCEKWHYDIYIFCLKGFILRGKRGISPVPRRTPDNATQPCHHSTVLCKCVLEFQLVGTFHE